MILKLDVIMMMSKNKYTNTYLNHSIQMYILVLAPSILTTSPLHI